MTWDRRLYFPSEGRRVEDFFALKNQMASAGFEPANLGTKGQHATPRPPKPYCIWYGSTNKMLVNHMCFVIKLFAYSDIQALSLEIWMPVNNSK